MLGCQITMCLLISSVRLLIARPAVWSIAYSCLAIALLTLNPYRFQAYSPEEWWVLRFRLSDICQNIALFLSLGILLRHRLKLPYRRCLLSGFLLSLSIETAQLFLASRTSNYVDLLSNAAGALLGALIYSYDAEHWDKETPNLDLALMLIPICWVRSFLVLIMPSWIGLLGLYAIAAFALLTSGSARPRPWQSLIAIGLWSLVAFAPMARYLWKQGIEIATLALFLNWVCNRLSSPQKRCETALGISFGLSLVFCSMWMLKGQDRLIQFWPNLPVIEVLLSAATLVYAWSAMGRGDRRAQLEP